MRFTKITSNVVHRPTMRLHRRSFAIWVFAAKCPLADVCLNKWTDLCKVLVSFWFDRKNRFWGVAVAELLS